MANFFKSLFSGKKEAGNETGNDKAAKKNFDILKYDGIRAQRMGKVDYAVKCYTNALEIEEDFEVMGYLSQLYIQTEEYKEAEELLSKMIETEPEVIASYLTLSNLLFIQEKYPEMIQVLEKGVAIEEGNVNTHYLLAKAKKSLNKYQEAVEHLTRAITLQEDLIEPFLMRAEVYLDMKQYADGLADIEKVLQLQDEEEHALLLRGRINDLTEKYEEAEKDYLQVIALNPFHDQAFINLAQLYNKQNKYQDAIKLCDEAIDFNSNSVALYTERSEAKLAIGDKEGADNDAQIATQLNNAVNQNTSEAGMKEEEPKNSLGLPF
ncbi:lipopolysaccharide assembly protein LapB [Bacteroides sp. 519]|uniref:tetratricopeptide repeat protein n=1 Tax=Bacteroides sp. 519 TaxID=2302937 RepID=UPI0013D46372|nr:tetratricopeptide repeat protein [Bacteroides sp. 519]NDV57900.1 hypothetical protein [Bacteroides sp. 519]